MRVEDGRVAVDLAARDEVDQAGHRLPLVDRVGDHALEAAGAPDRLERRLVGDPVRAGVVTLVEDDLVVAQLAADVDHLRRPAGDARDLGAGLGRRRRAVDADHPPRALLARPPRAPAGRANPATIPACVLPVTEQTTTVSKKTPSSRSCASTSSAQPAKPRPPSSWADPP